MPFSALIYIKTYKSKQNFAHNLKLKKNLTNSKTYLAKNKFFVVSVLIAFL